MAHCQLRKDAFRGNLIVCGLLIASSVGIFCGPLAAADVESAIVRVSSGDIDGSGTLIHKNEDSGFILTACHVVGSRSSVDICWCSGERGVGRVIASDFGADLALVSVEVPTEVTTIEFDCSTALPVGARLVMAGYGQGKFHAWVSNLTRTCWHSGSSGFGEVSLWLETSEGETRVGDSGGPMLYNGKLVGIISRGRATDTNHAAATFGPSANAIAKFCKKHLRRL